MITGPDVSGHQPTWSPQPEDEFVFVKATEGRTYTSRHMAGQVAAARAKGLVVGFYHYMWPGNAAAQAAYFVQQALIEPGDLLVCDWEKTGGGVPTETDKELFLSEVKRLAPQHRVGLYVNASMWNASTRHAGDFLWVAHYGVTKPNVTEPWTFWQWTDHPIDQNHGQFASRATLRAWAEALIQEDDMSPEQMEQLADLVTAKLLTSTNLNKIATAVLKKDGLIENVGIHPEGGTHVTLATAIEVIAERTAP